MSSSSSHASISSSENSSGTSEDDFLQEEQGSAGYLYQPIAPPEVPSTSQGTRRVEPAGPPRKNDEDASNWCKCKQCIVWPTEAENICCQEQMKVDEFRNRPDPDAAEASVLPLCITDHVGFFDSCLRPWVLRTAYWSYREHHGADLPGGGNRQLRYIAYRQFVRLVYHFLGRTIRVPLPSCVYRKIRERYPDSSQQYTGFLEA